MLAGHGAVRVLHGGNAEISPLAAKDDLRLELLAIKGLCAMAVVLIAEDNADVRAVLERVLTRAGLTVLAASDGRGAWQLATATPPDVVVTDLDMPGMTGLQLCAAIRADPVLADVPVAILSGSLRHGDPRVAEARACGAWLKPFANAELVSAVQRLLAAGRHDHCAVSSACPLSAASV